MCVVPHRAVWYHIELSGTGQSCMVQHSAVWYRTDLCGTRVVYEQYTIGADDYVERSCEGQELDNIAKTTTEAKHRNCWRRPPLPVLSSQGAGLSVTVETKVNWSIGRASNIHTTKSNTIMYMTNSTTLRAHNF